MTSVFGEEETHSCHGEACIDEGPQCGPDNQAGGVTNKVTVKERTQESKKAKRWTFTGIGVQLHL